jgi:hypothetical protein
MTVSSYPRYYTVNDRPVMIEQLPDGGTDCFVFDHQSGDFVVDRDYFTYTLPGSGKDVEQLAEEDFARVVSWCCIDVVRRWADKLCQLEQAVTAAELMRAIGLDRPLVANGTGMEMASAPLGADQVTLTGGELGSAYIDIRLPEGALTRAHLDARFGVGQSLPRVGASHPQPIAYQVVVAGAPARCTLFGNFRNGIGDADPVSYLVLRTERGSP